MKRILFRELAVAAVVLALAAAALASLACDHRHDGGASSILPTVTGEGIDKDEFQFCEPWDGVGHLLKRTPQSTEHRPDFFCFVGDRCFYRCPPGAGSR